MNPANLQLEGLYVAVAAVLNTLREKGVLSMQEIDQALLSAENKIESDPQRRTKLSDSNREAICFPLRFLRLANQTASIGQELSFSELTTRVGQSKED
jgi:hypothetical protein